MNTVFLYIKVAVSLVISFWSTRLVLSALSVYLLKPSIWRVLVTVLASTATLAMLTYLVGLNSAERQWLHARLRRFAGRAQG